MNTTEPIVSAGPSIAASVIIVGYHSADCLEACLDSVFAQELPPGALEVIVVDNASTDNTVDLIRDRYGSRVKLIANEQNVGFAAANNQAYLLAEGDTIFLVNPDSVLQPQAIRNTIEYLEAHPECGIAGALLLDDDGTRAPSARRFPCFTRKAATLSGLADRFAIFGGADYEDADHTQVLDVDWVPGAFTGLKRAMLEEIGFFDERFFLYYEETDLCLRAKSFGWAVRYLPDVVVHHTGGASSKKVKHHSFDEAGSQVRPFRLRSECLYHRKNRGLVAMLATVGFEYGWHQLRCLANLRPGRLARAKRSYSRTMAREIARAMADTSLGSICPPKPW